MSYQNRPPLIEQGLRAEFKSYNRFFFGREIDPRSEIIAPALAIRKAGYGKPTRNYKQELRDALRELA